MIRLDKPLKLYTTGSVYPGLDDSSNALSSDPIVPGLAMMNGVKGTNAPVKTTMIYFNEVPDKPCFLKISVINTSSEGRIVCLTETENPAMNNPANICLLSMYMYNPRSRKNKAMLSNMPYIAEIYMVIGFNKYSREAIAATSLLVEKILLAV
ncbi:hypothetical protein [Desulfurococcus amylolyticus]|uniref:hypothetical protein n=1 Tax=Desulfurococcus amylolyticus TaxID=94694 RepID=UPI0006623CE7|nr:hypothetical protein [Desulfurococcus amylolyticus]